MFHTKVLGHSYTDFYVCGSWIIWWRDSSRWTTTCPVWFSSSLFVVACIWLLWPSINENTRSTCKINGVTVENSGCYIFRVCISLLHVLALIKTIKYLLIKSFGMKVYMLYTITSISTSYSHWSCDGRWRIYKKLRCV